MEALPEDGLLESRSDVASSSSNHDINGHGGADYPPADSFESGGETSSELDDTSSNIQARNITQTLSKQDETSSSSQTRNIKKQHDCGICGEKFSRASLLESHLDMHRVNDCSDVKNIDPHDPGVGKTVRVSRKSTRAKNKMFTCVHCDGKFKTKRLLAIHVKKHKDISMSSGDASQQNKDFENANYDWKKHASSLESFAESLKATYKKDAAALKESLDDVVKTIKEQANVIKNLSAVTAEEIRSCEVTLNKLKGDVNKAVRKQTARLKWLKNTANDELQRLTSALSDFTQSEKPGMDATSVFPNLVKFMDSDHSDAEKETVADDEGDEVGEADDFVQNESLDTDFPDGSKVENQAGAKISHQKTSVVDFSGIRIYNCKLCAETFRSKSSLCRHRKRIHTGEKPHMCEVCGFRFMDSTKLKVHMRVHTGERPYQCQMCGEKFSQLGHLKNHMTRHSSEKPYMCETCGKSFKRKTSLTLHARTHLAVTDRPYRCTECGDGFIQKSALNEHMNIHTGVKPHLCSICGKAFSLRANLHSHAFKHHGSSPKNKRPESERQFTCEECGKSYKDRVYLKVHMRTHSGERPYQCTVCDRRFFQLAHLVTHKKTHTGERPYGCNICGKRFAVNGNLTAHMKIHSGEKPYSCSFCGKQFIQLNKLNKHISTSHGGQHQQPVMIVQDAFYNL